MISVTLCLVAKQLNDLCHSLSRALLSLVVYRKMSSRSVYFFVLAGVILLSHHAMLGKLNYVTTKSGWMSHSDPYRKQLVELQNYGNGFSLKGNHKLGSSRNKRAASGPVASTPYILRGDHHQYATVHYSGDDSDVVFVLTYDRNSNNNHVISSSLYRSTNYGKTFVSESGKFPTWSKLYPRYHFSQDKKTVVFPDDNSRTIYVSRDEGVSYTYYSVPVNQKSLLYHPTESEWVLGFDEIYHQLKVSLDLGNTWTLVSGNVRSLGDYSWGVPGVDWRIDAIETRDLSKLYFNTYDPNNDTGVVVDSDVSLMISQFPFGSSSSRVFDNNLGLHDAFLILDNYIFVQRTVNEKNRSREVELLVSYNRKPFSVARIPFEDSHQDYYVGTYRSAQVFVVVRHTSGLDNLYFSDETGTYYSLSLDNIVLDEQNGLDLELIKSMNGTFIANQLQYISGHSAIRTIITFDNGAEWHLLPAPEVTKDGGETDCEVPLCSLHFHMYSTDFSHLGVYSRSSAPGIIIAHGSYGQSLSSSNIDVYISRDGGLRWDQTLRSSWDAQIIDHGGLLVAAKDYYQLEETFILYSCDEGRSWDNFTFSNTSTVIWGVVTEPGETTTEVTLFGSEDRSNPEWAIISINFAGVFQRTCSSSDYWQWAVSDGRTNDQNCLLGESRVFERRKTEVCCLSGEKYVRIISAIPCECSREDFECDWGYRSDDYNGGMCVVDSNFDGDRGNQSCTSGYRKIAGDTCEGGVSDDIMKCTPTTAGFQCTTSAISTNYPTTTVNQSGNDSNDTTVLVVLAILLAVSFIVIIILGTALIYTIRRKRPHGHQPGAFSPDPVCRLGGKDDDEDEDDVALLRPEHQGFYYVILCCLFC